MRRLVVKGMDILGNTPGAKCKTKLTQTLGVGDCDQHQIESQAGGLIHVTPDQVIQARQQLIAADLIAYRKPLYQVLALDTEPTSARAKAPQSAAQILRQILGGSQ